ncbi:MAG: DEAD/DEAH box helicase [Planctomycetota bacterium]|nr:DEAD/DEAH box helicase [Rhodocyclaceae bacterium]GIK54203.1 MAG: DEAD/DEAH box helicase [Planctomycetota bacterium]
MQPLIVANEVRRSVADFLATAFPSTTPGFQGLIERFLAQPENLFRGPYLTIALPFRAGGDERARFAWLAPEFVPHAHQSRAWERLTGGEGRSTLVATGTGSGKTECFLYPILDHCREQLALGRPGIKAIILYPMNALATDQAKRLAKLLLGTPALAGIRAGLYVGETPDQVSDSVRQREDGEFTLINDRDALRRQPPDILLTNYKMLDFLLIRAEDSGLWARNRPDSLRYLVVDELHTFDGAQGTDLACLIRRVKARLDTPPGHLVCVGTSATLGDAGGNSLLEFAGDVFGEKLDEKAVIGEDRLSVGEYLADCTVEFMSLPRQTDAAALEAGSHASAREYLAEACRIWFEEPVTAEEVEYPEWRVALGERLKGHVAFQNLLRDMDKLGRRAVPVEDLLHQIARRLRGGGASPEFTARWLESLVALIAHARRRKNPRQESLRGEEDLLPLLSIRVELWLRELRRMVAAMAQAPALRHQADLGPADKAPHLPVIHCRDCHATGWGATIPKTSPNQLQADLQAFYTAFFAEDVSTRFIFPAGEGEAERSVFEPKKVCALCGTLHTLEHASCSHCGAGAEGEPGLLRVDIAANRKEIRRHGSPLTVAHHDCPYCGGRKTLTILGSQAASLASVAISQFYGSRFNADKKLIAFSDSVQDAAHRAGFFAARTWRLNLRPAMAQVIAAAEASGQTLTLADLFPVFERHWQERLGLSGYVANFLPPQLNWLRDAEALFDTGELPKGSDAPRLMSKVLPWVMLAEFGQDAHVGRTLPATLTASVAVDAARRDAATAHLASRLRGEIEAMAGVNEVEVRRFIDGLIGRMQEIGAWWDQGLVFYARQGARAFAYRKNPAEYRLLSGPRPPRYLTLTDFYNCTSIHTDTSGAFRDWAYKSLPALRNLALGADALVLEVYRLALDALANAGIARAEEGEKSIAVWGLEPAVFRLHAGAARWQCAHCRQMLVTAADADMSGEPCRRIGCGGSLKPVEDAGSFYRSLYLSAEIQRVFAREHTGLLDRPAREGIERAFMAREQRPGKVNLLSATPTLEMGIDIGDLSATLMCSVPPAQANYFQRGGRAGRETGNAFLLTLAAARPHDLYFWADPRQMMAGDVSSPGVFLNASAVLERQLTAFTLDTWVREAGAKAKIPHTIRPVLGAVLKGATAQFPYPWLEYVELHRATLQDRFIRLFEHGASVLTEETRQWLSGFIAGDSQTQGSLPWRIISSLRSIAEDVEEFRKRRERVDAEIRKIEALPVKGESDEEELEALRQESAALGKLVAGIFDRATLNVLTDEGLLPNYAFPEQGVLLHSVILRNRKAGEGIEVAPPLTLEYERPGAAAITELAPGSLFYAESRKVTIEQVDISKDRPVKWRFCRQCAYSEPIELGDGHQACPRCGDTLWKDMGRVRDMLRLTKVYARTPDHLARIADDSDERERRFFVRQALVDSQPEAVRQAFAIERPEFPFAFEFLNRVSFREINFGERAPDGAPMTIAGIELPRPGFAICADCGTLQRKRKEGEEYRNHAPYCPRRKADSAPVQRCVFLYREFHSEGIRVYLPEATFGGAEERLQSFVAALQLGLARRFRGAVDHLRIALDIRLATGEEAPRQYLVIYDSVPGGTGYLKELMRDEQPLFEVFESALQAMDSCECNHNPEKDGCYRCLYAYRNSHDREKVSRRMAQKLLREVLDHRTQLKPVSGLHGLKPANPLFDSELEARFVEALRRTGEDGGDLALTEVLVKGKPGYLVACGNQGGRRWRIEPQVDLGTEDGVVIPCKPDFVFWPDDDSGDTPIAVFLDGWQFHREIIAEDMAKRLAIAKSGRFEVWTLTWADVDHWLNPKKEAPISPWPSLLASDKDVVGDLLKRFHLERMLGFKAMPVFAQVRMRLCALDHDMLRRHAALLGMGILMPHGEAMHAAVVMASDLACQLKESGLQALPEEGAARIGGRRLADGMLMVAAGIGAAQGAMLMKGELGVDAEAGVLLRWHAGEGAPEAERQSAWQALWQTLNLLLPLTRCWAGTDAGCEWSRFLDAPLVCSPPGGAADLAWIEAMDLARREVQEWMSALAELGVPAPGVGYELVDEKGRVVAEAELAWPGRMVAVFTEDVEAGMLEAFSKQGWRCFRAISTDVDAGLVAILQGKEK